jgi:predicted  nucleic acid-binding Zn-ribbon protein
VMFRYPPPAARAMAPVMTRVSKARNALAEAMHNLEECVAMLDAADEDREVAKNQIDDVQGIRSKAKEILEKLPPR